MSAPLETPAPPLAGVCSYEEAARVGASVDATVARLRRYVYFKTQLFLLFAERFNGVPEWEVKGAFSLHLWQAAEHGTWFRDRIVEMRTPPHHLDKVPEEALALFFAQVRSAANTNELLVAIYRVILPALAEAMADHLREAHPLADYPTRRLLRFVEQEDQDQLEWGKRALRALVEKGPGAVDADTGWETHLQAYLQNAGGVNGDGPREKIPLPAPRLSHPETTKIPRRDARFPHVWNSRGVVPAAETSVHARIWWMMNVRLNEMHVSELIATVIADWKGQPWEFYHDLARHLWDETRHCMLGEVAFASQGIDFTQIPTHTGFAEYPNAQLSPPERYAFLWGIEQGLMAKSGKQAELALAQAGGDERAAVFQDFDWADEVLHAQIGRRWLEPSLGGREKMGDVYEKVRPHYDEMKAVDLQKPGRDWWPDFYAKYLQGKDPEPKISLPAAPPSGESGY